MEIYLILIAIILDVLSVTGMQLNASGKLRTSFWVWLVANFAWVAYDIVVEEYIQAILFIVYAIQCVFGLTRKKKVVKP
jgi:hypothetical protein